VPDDALSLYNLGLIDYDNECYEAAITNWLGCIQYSHETDPDLYYGLGLAYEGMQQWQTALEVYERSCQLHPEHLESKISTARLAYELGEMAHAKTLLDELLIDNDENEDSLLYAALVAAALQDWEAAQLHAAKLLTLDDEHAHAFNVLGVAYFHLKRYEDAEECFEAALELDDQWVSPMSNLAYVYEKQGRLTNAKMRFRQVQTCRALTLQLETDSYWMLQYLKDPQQAEAVQAERLAADAAEEVEVLAEPLYYRGKVLELVKKSILVDVVMPPAEEDEAVLDSVGIDQNPAEATD
jgi:tetratricopeptide (TPR) repeat protein